ncbi:SFT2-domain-containing protein [Hesseltinella vesiculosa]|uniref:Protein transport protein SFT2 n=1 Tax=Hesseltinella vesiculosa TaxID=101127 RepID=A0A1X2GVM6_9FUNG|nr:SFT2-domain-containing protein [Hesseltinella vesiculosa]
MTSNTESSFRDSLRNFNLSRSNNGISLPTDSAASTTFDSFRSSASDWFSNVSSQVQGYLPVNTGEEEEEPWFQLSRMERIMAFALCLGLGILCFFLAFSLFLFMIPIVPGKFAATFTLGSILVLTSIAMLRGPWAHMKHMISMDRLPFTLSYVGSMALTLYASLMARNYILTIIFAILQIIALLWYVGSYIPGGISTLRYGTAYVGRRAASILPV